ncbi:MAG: F0F1 ATP synthase subunit epsilon [Planctomycetota bacterium]
MADQSFRCRLITPTARLLDAEVSYADVPLHDGQVGVMPQTAPIVGELGPGELRLDMPASGTRSYYIDGGFMQHVAGELTILSTGATDIAELDLEEEKAAFAEATARTSLNTDEMDVITADRNKARVRVALASRG